MSVELSIRSFVTYIQPTLYRVRYIDYANTSKSGDHRHYQRILCLTLPTSRRVRYALMSVLGATLGGGKCIAHTMRIGKPVRCYSTVGGFTALAVERRNN